MSEVEPLVYIDWNDDGATIQCERPECMSQPGPSGHRYWWWELLPYHCTPEQAQEAIDRHLATHS